MKIIVCGSRSLAAMPGVHAWIGAKLKALHDERGIDVVVHGGARGPDRIASTWAESQGIDSIAYHPDWLTYGSSAGLRRNVRMLELEKPELVVAFWNGHSSGTKHMIDKAREAGVEVLIHEAPRS